MEFKFTDKEVYTSQDVTNILEQHFTFVKKQVKEKQETKWNSQLVETKEALEALKTKLTEKETELETVTKEKTDLNAKVESLETEVTPFRKKELESKFSNILEGKVVETAREDVLSSLGFTIETTEEEATLALDSLLEEKPYFKVSIPSDNKELIENKPEVTPEVPASTGMGISITGE